MANIFDNNKNLPHYNARKEAGIGKEDVLYQNNFIATVIPPAGIGNTDLLTAQVTSISGNITNPGNTAVTQTYRGAERSYANGKLDQTFVDITLNFNLNLNESNQLYIYNQLSDWTKRIHDPETGRRSLKRDYVGQIIVEHFNRAGDIFKRTIYYDCFITSGLPELGGDYTSGDIVNLEGVVFRSDTWKTEDV